MITTILVTFDCLLSVGNFFEVIEHNSEIGKSAIGPNKAPFWKKVSLVFRTTYHYTYSSNNNRSESLDAIFHS